LTVYIKFDKIVQLLSSQLPDRNLLSDCRRSHFKILFCYTLRANKLLLFRWSIICSHFICDFVHLKMRIILFTGTRSQIHQHFTHAFVYESLLWVWLWTYFCVKNARVKCWWNRPMSANFQFTTGHPWSFCLFICEFNIYLLRTSLILWTLTVEYNEVSLYTHTESDEVLWNSAVSYSLSLFLILVFA